MATSDDAIGSDIPSLSADQEAAFAAEEAQANAARADAKGTGHARLNVETDEDGTGGQPAAPPAPAAPAAAAPAAPAAPAVVDPDDDVPDAVTDEQGRKFVPVATMVNMRKNFQGQLKDKDALMEEGNKRLTQLFEIAQRGPVAVPAAPAAPPAPVVEANPFDKTTHPLEHLEWKADKAERDLAAINDWRKNQEESSAQTRALGEARTAYVTMHKQFMAANPSYDSAYRHVMDTWTAVNKATGMTHDEAVKAANQLEWQVVSKAAQQNKHPSAVMMDIAKAANWTAPAPAAGAPASGTPAAAPALTPEKQIKMAAEGGSAAISLSDAAGGSAPAALTMAQLVAMPKEEFHSRFSGAAGEAEFRKLAMGRKSSMVA